MDFSEKYHARKKHLESLEIPTISETKERLGEPLAEIMFDLCPESLREEMSIGSKLSGAGEELWISPSDLLIQKVVLKPPFTNKHMKALTHEGLLEIGGEIELKFLNEMEAQKQKELTELECLLKFIAERDKNKAVADAIAKEQHAFKLKLMSLNEEFQELLQDELTRLEEHLKEMYENLMEEKMLTVLQDQEDQMEAKVNAAVEEALKVITQKFMDDLDAQEAELTEMFNAKLEAQKEKYQKFIKNEQEVFQIVLKQLKHNLQCNNIANLMYLLCVERRKCLLEQQNLVNMYERKLRDLTYLKEQREHEIMERERKLIEKQKQINIREHCLLGIIRQFQKFINFALRSVPTQAEFLLSVEKMMLFELTQAIASVAAATGADPSDTKHHMVEFMPWKKVSKTSLDSDRKAKDMKIEDYHNCLNELPIPRSDSQGPESLYAVTFNEHLYVREDFRNQISHGFAVTPSNLIWNKDVENLVKLLRSSYSEDVGEMSSEGEMTNLFGSHLGGRRSSVRFDQERAEKYEGNAENVGLLAAQDSFILQKSVNMHMSYIDELDAGTKAALLGVTDSLTLVKNVDHIDHTKVDVVEKSPQEEVFKKISIDTIKLCETRKEKSPDTSPEHKLSIEDQTVFKNVSADTLFLNMIGKVDTNKNKTHKSDSLSLQNVRTKPKSSPQSSSTTTKKTTKHVYSPPEMKQHSMSKLSFHRDSLELMKRANMPTKNVREAVVPSVGKIRTIINMPYDDSKMQEVDFVQVADVFQEMKKFDEPWNIYAKKSDTIVTQTPQSRDRFLTKPNVAKIIGEQGNEYKDTCKDFTVHRIHSIIDVLKKDDSLIRMFTGCGQ